MEPGTWIPEQPPPSTEARAVSTHLSDLPPADVGKTLEGKGQHAGCSVDGEALAGRHLLLASEEGEREVSAVPASH